MLIVSCISPRLIVVDDDWFLFARWKGDSFEKRHVVLIVTQKAKRDKAKRGEYLLLHEEVISVIIDRLYDKKDNNVALVQNKPMGEFLPLTVTSSNS